MRFGMLLQKLLPSLVHDKRSTPKLGNNVGTSIDGKSLFQSMPMGDAWAESEINKLNKYLFGNRHLQIPHGWRELIVDSIERATAT